MYARYAQCGVGHDIQNPASSRRQYADPAEDDVEDQSLYDNTEASSSDPPEVAEEGEPNTADSDTGCKEDNEPDEDTGENSDSSVDEDEGGEGEAGLCDMYHISF